MKKLIVLLLVLALTAGQWYRGAVTVFCPGGPAPTKYYYDLVGPGTIKTITVVYDPGDPDSARSTLARVPPGTYRLLENGVFRASVTVYPGLETVIYPQPDWPVMPAMGPATSRAAP